MKILFLSSSFSGGGISSFAHEVANAYAKENVFSIILGNDSKVPLTIQGVNKYYINCDDLSVKNATRLIELINSNICPDVIIGSNAKILPIIAQFLNDSIKIITVSHSLKYIESDVAAMAHRYVDYIIAGSEYNGQNMARRFGVKDKSKIKVIYNFVKDHPDYLKIIEQKKQAGEISIVFPGACAPSKSPDIVLQILRKIVETDANFKFYWMGRTTIHLSRHFPFLHVRNVKDLVPNDSRIVFPGRLPTREEAETLIASGNIQLSPSRREGCPMSFLEAMRVGSMAIVADFGNFNREIVEKGSCGFVFHYNDIDGFANQIVDICKNPQDFVQFYDNAYNTFLKELSYTVWKKRMDNLIYVEGYNHVKRSEKLSLLKLRINIAKLKWMKFESDINRTLFEDIKVLLRMWRLKKIDYLRNNR